MLDRGTDNGIKTSGDASVGLAQYMRLGDVAVLSIVMYKFLACGTLCKRWPLWVYACPCSEQLLRQLGTSCQNGSKAVLLILLA